MEHCHDLQAGVGDSVYESIAAPDNLPNLRILELRNDTSGVRKQNELLNGADKPLNQEFGVLLRVDSDVRLD